MVLVVSGSRLLPLTIPIPEEKDAVDAHDTGKNT